MIRAFVLLAVSFTLILASRATYGGLVVSKLGKVYDGDTFHATIANVHPILGDNILVRVNGVDTPEIRAHCPKEKLLALKAKRFTKDTLEKATFIELRNIRRGKYFRILADVWVNGRSLTEMLLNRGLAVPYKGKTKKNWCKP